MPKPPSRRLPPIRQLLQLMATLRSPEGCPWDREQDHRSLRYHAVEEVYELLDAVEAGDDHEMGEELGDLLLQVIFHCQLAQERGAFDFDSVTQRLVDKLVRRHPHVYGDTRVRDVDQVWVNWDRIKRAEKEGTRHARPSVFDGIPRHLPALMRVEKLVKKARKSGVVTVPVRARVRSRRAMGEALFELAALAQQRGWSAEDLLRAESLRRERVWRAGEVRGDEAVAGARKRTPRRKRS